jgi:predicted thioredoxin/glutaredoxin
MSSTIKLYFHPTCATSHELIINLYKKGYLNKIEIYNLIKPLEKSFIWSVPWLVEDNEPIGTDPISDDEVINIIENKNVYIENPEESFMMSILHSSYASSIAILHKDLSFLINDSLIKASIRYGFSGVDISNLKAAISKNKDRLFEEYRDKIRRALSVSFVRELYWSKSGKINSDDIIKFSDPTVVGLWLLSKGSIGRIGLPKKPFVFDDIDVKEISEFVAKRGKGLLEKIKEEQENIYNDKLYWEIIEKI